MMKRWVGIVLATAVLVSAAAPIADATATTRRPVGIFDQDGNDITHLFQDEIDMYNISPESTPKPEEPQVSASLDAPAITEQPARAAAEGRGYSANQGGGHNMVLEIDLTNKVVTAYGKNENGDYKNIIRQMICSVGTDATPTVSGWYQTSDRARWYYFAEFDVFAQYMTRFYGGYMFHSVLFNKQSISSLSTTSVGNLGKAVSHGCVRLTVADAKWIFNNAKSGTKVYSGDFPKDSSLTSSLKKKVSTSAQKIIYDPYTPMPASMTIPRPKTDAPKKTAAPKPAPTSAPAKVISPTTLKPNNTPKPATPKPATQKPAPTPAPSSSRLSR